MKRPLTLEQDIARSLNPSVILEDNGIAPQTYQRDALTHWREDQLFLCSRHAGKSSTGAAMGLHAAQYIPEHPVILASRVGRQSGEMFRTARRFYNNLPNPPRLIVDSATTMEFDTGARILAMPGSEETVRGIAAASAIIIDEAGYVDEDMLFALEPMLSTTGGPLWIMSTAAGARGFFYDYCQNPEGFRFHNITVDDCPHIKQEHVEKRRKRWPKHKFEQEFYNVFHDADEQLFSSDLVDNCINHDLKALGLPRLCP